MTTVSSSPSHESRTLICINFQIYIPEFDGSTGVYKDVCPYQPYQRVEKQPFECRCRAGCVFRNSTEFHQHIKSLTHREFIKNYSKYYQEVDNMMDENKKLRVETEIKTRKIDILSKKASEYDNLKKTETDYHELLKKNRLVIKSFKQLQTMHTEAKSKYDSCQINLIALQQEHQNSLNQLNAVQKNLVEEVAKNKLLEEQLQNIDEGDFEDALAYIDEQI